MTFLRVFETSEAIQLSKIAGLSPSQIKQLRVALVDSKLARQILSELSSAQRSQIAAATKVAHAAGTAHAIEASAIVAVIATVALFVVWPSRRRAHQLLPEPEPSSSAV
jgi:putative effector of murein hydrolase